jgi:hypothetical protein
MKSKKKINAAPAPLGERIYKPGEMIEVDTNPVLIRTFETGATRDTASGKLDYEGFLSPLVLQRFAVYMHSHRIQSDGTLRDSDNWKKGIPIPQYLKSMFRHFMDAWLILSGFPKKAVCQDLEEVMCAVMFNAMGLLHEVLKGRYTCEHSGSTSSS